MNDKLGKVTIAPGVLLTIVRLTALSVPGVTRMSGNLTGSVNRFLGRAHVDEGVSLLVEDDMVTVDLHIVVDAEANMLKVGRNIQSEVARAISDMVGMGVKQVNVHIENVDVERRTA